MHLTFRNINGAFVGMVKAIYEGDLIVSTRSSRVGDIICFDEPLIVTYERPRERVLLNSARDQNCFFTLYESLWMLAGRNDVSALKYYNSRMSEFSDDGSTFHGAYGYRWRTHFGIDQLESVMSHLSRSSDTRRAVVSMWDARSDLPKLESGVDLPCNLECVFCVNEKRLDMSVFNRSNDGLWGLLGANQVHFGFLLEYMSNKLGLEVGKYHQITSHFHLYKDRLDFRKWLEDSNDPYIRNECPETFQLGGEFFDGEVLEFVNHHSKDALYKAWKDPFLFHVAQPLCIAFHHHKRREYKESLQVLESVRSWDWQRAAKNWITKRRDNWDQRSTKVEKKQST